MIAGPNHQGLQAPTRRAPWAWGYGRQSHQSAIEAGEGIPNQGSRTQAYWQLNLQPNGVEQFHFIPDDSAVSARTSPFMLRVAGKTLMTVMQEGDHFIVDKIDRLWRNREDFVDVTREFRRRGITLHIVNLMGLGGVQLGTPMGDFFLGIMVGMAQLESDQVSDRTKAGKRAKRAQGKYQGSGTRAPIGCAVTGKVERHQGRVVSNTQMLYWDDEYRRFMAEIVRLADEERRTAAEIGRMMKTHFRQMFGDKFYYKRLDGKYWTRLQIVKHYWREKQYQVLGRFDPNRIRFLILNPPGKYPFRDIGPDEPSSPNPFPYLDGRPIPTWAELYKIGG